jgi:transketolase
MNLEILQLAARDARGLAIDAVHACSSGHLGLPLGAAEIGAALFGQALRYWPDDPRWLGRDRFVLSAGHGSMFLYSWLHLAGYDLPMEELRDFRQLHSRTPGHPEFGETAGVEATTGPLGQGVGNAVGMAVSGKKAAERYGSEEHLLFDHHVVCLAGDGCLQEGVSREAVAFAGHNGLDNLILIYDSNDVTLDAMAEVTQSEDVAGHYVALGWEVWEVDGHDIAAFLRAYEEARLADNGKPKLIIARTEIGRGIPEVAGTQKGHGEGGAKYAEEARRGIGLPEETFYVSPEVRAFFEGQRERLSKDYEDWQARFGAWSRQNPGLAAELLSSSGAPDGLLEKIPEFDPGKALATRVSGGLVMQAVAKEMPWLLTGSADLFGSTKNYIEGGGDYSRDGVGGRNLWFGIREHAMGAICNGIAYDGLFRASGATFLVFADYLRPSIRLAALAGLPVTYLFTHDSVGVGEDGPTHQPVETVSGLRVIPGLDVIRPADGEEVAGAFAAAMGREDGPTALVLTRQNVPSLPAPVQVRREGVLRGGYVLVKEEGELRAILLATGSEVQHAVEAAARLGGGIRVVSMPCLERFDRQPQAYRDEILPASCRRRVAMEAGVSGLWWKYVGDGGKVLGIDRFGISAPGEVTMSELGMTVDALVEAVG